MIIDKIVEYHRPARLEDALALLARSHPVTLPLAGGTALNRVVPDLAQQQIAVVDLQALGLDTIQFQGSFLHLGATLTLQALLKDCLSTAGRGPALEHKQAAGSTGAPPGLAHALSHCVSLEATYNLRQAATVAGALVAADGRSPFAVALLALDATLVLQPGDESLGLGDLLPLRTERLPGRLITSVILPLNARLAYQAVARTPADRPIVCTAAATWPSGRVRVVLGGYGSAPALVFDGAGDSSPERISDDQAEGARNAARSAYSQAGDPWASAEYRQEMAGILTARCLRQLQDLP